jgi:hypothetical protein
MDCLEKWLKEQIDEKKVEPNSALGEAIFYMKNHWTELVQFLHVPGLSFSTSAGFSYFSGGGMESFGMGYYMGHFGLKLSSFATRRPGSPAPTRLSLTRGVLPIVSRMFAYFAKPNPPFKT